MTTDNTASKELELLPCPFCGASAGNVPLSRGHGFIVGCGSCQAQQFAMSRDEAVTAWNSRAAVAAPQGDDPRGSYTDGFRDGWKAHFDTLSPALVQQLCRDLNEAHNEILRQQGMAESDFGKYDWPEWSPQANSIRWAERETKTRQAKTDQWTLYPKQEQAPAPAEGKTGRID